MATYISLTNELLRRLNEVTMDVTDFSNAKNIQALAKDAINNAIREMLHYAQEWPFTLVTYTQTLTTGTGVYSFPTAAASVDWDSFYLKKSSTYNNNPGKLKLVTFDYYTEKLRPVDDNAGTGGYAPPVYVYQTQELKFGLSPLPLYAYEVEYKYWSFPDDLVLHSDVCIVPDRFKNVIIDGAMAYMMLFRSNEQSANIHLEKFDQGIRSMRRLLLDEPISVQSTAITKSYVSLRVM